MTSAPGPWARAMFDSVVHLAMERISMSPLRNDENGSTHAYARRPDMLTKLFMMCVGLLEPSSACCEDGEGSCGRREYPVEFWSRDVLLYTAMWTVYW